MNRIFWNDRPAGPIDGGDIDELVMDNVSVHITQMESRCWWIGITRPDGTYWYGNFYANAQGRMGFSEQENNGITWDRDEAHEVTP